jgi:predicted dehydrogenase
MTASNPHRVAVFGGGMVANWHVEGWRNAGAEVVAAVDVNPEALQAFGDRHAIGMRYRDYQEFLSSADADLIDIVDVCTPPWLHATMTLAALTAGKHVLCEKPFALSSNEASAMAEAADEAGRVLGCRQGDTRLAIESRTVADIVRSGALGDIYFMRLVGRALYRPGVEYNPTARWFLDRSKAGGGVLFDLGMYDLDLLFGIFGQLEVNAVVAATFTGVDDPGVDTPFDVEEHAVAMLDLDNGCKMYWEQAWATHLPEQHRWELYGTDGGLSFIAHSAVHRVDMDLRLTRYAPETPVTLPLPVAPEPGPNVYQDFLGAVDTGSSPACPAHECVRMLEIIEQVYAAAGVAPEAVAG